MISEIHTIKTNEHVRKPSFTIFFKKSLLNIQGLLLLCRREPDRYTRGQAAPPLPPRSREEERADREAPERSRREEDRYQRDRSEPFPREFDRHQRESEPFPREADRHQRESREPGRNERLPPRAARPRDERRVGGERARSKSQDRSPLPGCPNGAYVTPSVR